MAVAQHGRAQPPSATRGGLPARVRRVVAALLLGAWLPMAVPAQAGAEAPESRPGECGDPLLRVRYLHRIDLAHACEAWRRVGAFLVRSHGLRIASPVELAFVDRVEIDLGTACIRVLGGHDRRTGAISITSMTADWLRQPDRLMFRRPVDAELHTSLIVHEIVHAVLRDNYRGAGEVGHAASEYLAYAVQLATMEEEARAQVLAGYGEGDFGSLAEINDICHAVQPHEFGVRAYRHFLRTGEAGMLAMILSGGLQTELPP